MKDRKAWLRLVGRRLASAREEAGLTQPELVVLSGVSKSTISRAEMGQSTLKSGKLLDLCVALNRSPALILDFYQQRTDAEASTPPVQEASEVRDQSEGTENPRRVPLRF